jgi:hypothetical protein
MWATPAANADTHTCDQVEAETFEIDGMMDDWGGLRAHTTGASDDGKYELRCAYDDTHMYLSFDVRDQRIMRARKAKASTDDNLTVKLTVGDGKAGTLRIFPGDEDEKPVYRWNNKKTPKWLKVADSLQPNGWSAEMSWSLKKVTGWSRGTPAVNAHIAYNDKDGKKAKHKVLDFHGVLEFSGGAELMKSFLRAAGLKKKHVRLDVLADVDGSKGAERVVWAGKIIGVLSDTFTYMELPVKKRKDVKKVKVVDLRGDGTSSIVVLYRERGNGGTRDLVTVFNPNGTGGFDRLLAFEVRKSMDGNKLVNSWSLEPRGKYRNKNRKGKKRGYDIVVRADREPVGWDEDNYYEQPAPDVNSILLPWVDDVSAVYYFDGNAVQGGDPIVGDKP